MSNAAIKDMIRSALAKVPKSDFLAAAKVILANLGYRSERTLELSGSVDDFIGRFPAPNKNTKSEQVFRNDVQSAHILFQITGEEIPVSSQIKLFNTNSSFDAGTSKSFIFIACKLNCKRYPRGQYAQFTREINKRLRQPTVVLFKTTENLLTLAFVHRREHRRNPNRDVLGNVSLIREIDPSHPHRAHLDILAELSLEKRLQWMKSHGKARNFAGLLAAWLEALDTEALNKWFYDDLFNWFKRAVKEAKFPKNQRKTFNPEEHVIRLITRMLFVWFIKEKDLIADELFIEERIRPLLINYDRNSGDSYYRTVLQNLFFATLNTEIGRREFSKVSNTTHRDFSRYRYKSEISDPEALLALLARTPFINGGLFDCLDSVEAKRDNGYRIDCFTDNVIDPKRKDYGILSVPNRLFFDQSEKTPGLLVLFNRYKFTVEENTPVEQEVALDPELLGKVFENLLAAYNPETRANARKQTGTYYTPRIVVNYMVDEVLTATLAKKVFPDDGDDDSRQELLRNLLDYEDAFDDANELFVESEAAGIVQAISEIKVLDPAVGSGAFPMGILHKLTLALRRLDPHNNLWKKLQKQRARQRADEAFETRDQQERDAELLEISDTFERYSGDFGRKLYLIQNSIFGVDIQPVACQIAKLRFFISLAIEQEPDETANNLGIKPLPNLETRFVSANSLIRLQPSKEISGLLQDDAVQKLRKEIEAIREKYFLANNRSQKLRFIRLEKDCREQLERALEVQRAEWIERQKNDIERRVNLFSNAQQRRQLREEELREFNSRLANFDSGLDDAKKIANWDPYDQNATAKFFEPEWMFGVTDGFDVVIGNPPYIQLQKNRSELGKLYKDAGYATFAPRGDIYQLFCERGCQLLAHVHGLLAYITSNSWLKAEYGKPLRRYIAELHTPLKLLEMGKNVFENTIVDTSILLLLQGGGGEPFPAVDMDKLPTKDFPPEDNLWGHARPDGETPWAILSSFEQNVMDKMLSKGTPLAMWDVSINYGIKTGYNKAFIIDDEIRRALIAEDPNSAEIIKPVLRGRDVKRYLAQWAGFWLIDTHNGYGNVPAIDIEDYQAIRSHLDKFYPKLEKRYDKGQTPYNLRICAYHQEFSKEKLFWRRVARKAKFAYVKEEMQCINACFMLNGSSLKYLCAVLNSELISWYMQRLLPTSGTGTFHWEKVHVEPLPIPKINDVEERPFIRLIDLILTKKALNSLADTGEQESEINRLVYALYGLTDEEIRAVERR